MTDDEEIKFGELMMAIGEYYAKSPSPQVVELYWQALKQFDYQDVSRSIQRHMEDPDNGQFMPKIADIKRHITGSKDTQAMQAWAKVDRSIRRIGPWESVTFDDPITMRVLSDMGGWIDLCDTPTEKDLTFKMHEFSKRYQGYLLQGGVTEYPRLLTGHFGLTNARNGHEVAMPVLIGNEKRAQLVYERGSNKPMLEYKRASDLLPSVAGLIEKGSDDAA